MIRRLIALLRGRSAAEQDLPAVDSHTTQSPIERVQLQGKPCVQLRHSSGRAMSKLGGSPDLPPSLEWPVWKERALAFLGQLDLSAVRAAGGPAWLPSDGMLFFFFDREQSTWGFDPEDAKSWAVLYAADGACDRSALGLIALDSETCFPERTIDTSPGMSLPDPGRLGLELSQTEWEAIEVLRSIPFPCHQVGGYPNPIQNDNMELECQLVSHGLYLGNDAAYKSERAKEVDVGKADWRLLLQLDSDDDAGMMWGDSGMLYFWIREQDALAHDFSKVWMILQCC